MPNTLDTRNQNKSRAVQGLPDIDETVGELDEQLSALTLNSTEYPTAEKLAKKVLQIPELPAVLERRINAQKTFTPFRRLPTELRVLIWEHARPDPRIVRLSWSIHCRQGPDGQSPGAYSKAPIPTMLHACLESRQVALRWYRLAFAPTGNQTILVSNPFFHPQTYFDFQRDYLFLGCEQCNAIGCTDCWPHVARPEGCQVNNLLIPMNEECPQLYFISNNYNAARNILLLNPSCTALAPETKLSDLKAREKQFEWHKRETPEGQYVAKCAIYHPHINAHFDFEKIVQVELDVKANVHHYVESGKGC